jgi:hypothetical protein
MSRTLELLDWGSHAASPHVGSCSGPIGAPDSASPRQALRESVAAMPSVDAIAVFAAVESDALLETFFFSIFIFA